MIETKRKRYYRLKQAGKCIDHHRIDVVEGFIFCQYCLDVRAKRNKKGRDKAKQTGRCTNCRNVDAAEGKTICQACLDGCAKRQDKARQSGKCPGHPNVDAAEGMVRCQACVDADAKRRAKTPELRSVRMHHYAIFKSNGSNHRTYKGMPFYDEWNPNKGGSFQAGADWIIMNIGKRPEGRTLDIEKHELGFVPGNLRWLYPKGQIANNMRKRLTDQEREIGRLREENQRLREALAASNKGVA